MPLTVVAVCQTTVIDGRNGDPLVLPYIRSSVGAQTSPITVSLEGLGHDILHQCWHSKGKTSGLEVETGPFIWYWKTIGPEIGTGS